MNIIIDSLIKFMASSQIPAGGFAVKVHQIGSELLAQKYFILDLLFLWVSKFLILITFLNLITFLK